MSRALRVRIRELFTQSRLSSKASLTDEKLLRLLNRPDPVILEIGAHDGATTNRLLQLFESGTVFAFEPDPRAIQKHRASVDDPRASLFEIAIANENGTTTFHMSSGVNPYIGHEGDWDQSGSIHRPTGHLEVHPWVKFEREIEVAVMRLDTWTAEQGIGDIDFIWADVQGAEGDLIAGGALTLRRTRYFYTEYSDHQLYENQLTLDGILNLLPDFRVVERYEWDVLLGNTRFA